MCVSLKWIITVYVTLTYRHTNRYGVDIMCMMRIVLNKVDHFKVKLRLPLVYHVGFSIKGEDEVDGEFDGEVDGALYIFWEYWEPIPENSEKPFQ